jgi:hypothetical protein
MGAICCLSCQGKDVHPPITKHNKAPAQTPALSENNHYRVEDVEIHTYSNRLKMNGTSKRLLIDKHTITAEEMQSTGVLDGKAVEITGKFVMYHRESKQMTLMNINSFVWDHVNWHCLTLKIDLQERQAVCEGPISGSWSMKKIEVDLAHETK